MESSTQSLGDRQQVRADQVVALARRHAEEIRAAAEQDADQLLRSAEREAALRQQERREAEERERVRIAVSKQQLNDCLDSAATAILTIRQLIATLPDVDPPLPVAGSPSSASPAPAAAESSYDAAVGRMRMMNGAAIIFGLWAAGMIVALVFLTQQTGQPASPFSAESVQAAEPAPAPEKPAPPVAAASMKTDLARNAPTTGSSPAAAPVTQPQEPVTEPVELTVSFVAASECWISVTRDDGLATERLLKASETYVVRARDAISFKAGNAAALTLLINERPTRPLGAEGQVVSRRITRANYRSFLAS